MREWKVTATILQFIPMTTQHDNPPNRIREWRRVRGMTQEELAEALNIKQNQVSRMENGTSELTMTRLRALARIFDIDVGQLLAPQDNGFGLSEQGLALLNKVQDDPRLAQPLLNVADTILQYTPEPVAPAVVPLRRRGPY
jgi:transcriptional regulator with XRE-family HTH domain